MIEIKIISVMDKIGIKNNFIYLFIYSIISYPYRMNYKNLVFFIVNYDNKN